MTVAFIECGVEFNKGRVAKRILRDLERKNAESLDTKTLANFEKIATTLNRLVKNWNRESADITKPSAARVRAPESSV